MSAIRHLFLVLSVLVASTVCYKEPHEYFADKDICEVVSEKPNGQLFKIIQLKCDWVKFVDAEASAPKLEALTEKERRLQVPVYYEISFESSSLNTQPKYSHVGKNFLKDFKVRSLSMRKLNLISVNEHAFAKENFGTHCRKIDLSFNSLVRLDSHVLEHIDQLEVLILSHNDLKFSENNFAYNRLLSKLDLSFNKIQFLTPNIFHNLEDLRDIDLRGNNIREVKACTFNNVQTNSLTRKYHPVSINLDTNTITCDCDVFYLWRHRGFNITLTCDKPSYYKNKALTSLDKEDLDYRCNFDAMENACTKDTSLAVVYLVLIILLALFVCLLCAIALCCYCRSSSRGDQLKKLKEELSEQVAKSKPKKIYANFAALDGGKKASDTKALIEH